MSDQIIIRGLKLSCRIGVPIEERTEAQDLRAHLTLEVASFPKNDRVDETVDYQSVSNAVRRLAAEGERHLIETLAQDIASLVLDNFPVLGVKVELEKFILPETDWVGVIVRRSSLSGN